jgi:diacylglycerol O-acyltransferase
VTVESKLEKQEERMTAVRLSPLDDSFLAVETPSAHMHVGWAAVFEPPREGRRPTFYELRRHIESHLPRAPRYRQKISGAPLGLDAPSWVDDESFDVGRHVTRAKSDDLDQVVDECMSRQLDRDRPLWEICVADELADGSMAVVGKAHHCMVDGIAAVELSSLLLDPTPEPPRELGDGWRPEPAPGTATRLIDSVTQSIKTPFGLAGLLADQITSPPPLNEIWEKAASATATLGRSLRPATPVLPFNQRITERRRLARTDRPLADLQRVKQRYGTTINDVYLTVATGAVRRLMIQRNEEPVPLKTMVPVSVRNDAESGEFGNRISFMFVELPCQEPDPEARLRKVQMMTEQGKEGGDAGTGEGVLSLAGYMPRPLQKLISRLMASPRMFNLVVSNIPGPREPMYMLGCEMKAAYPVVPLADGHALSIGMTTVRDQACFGLYAGGGCIEDADRVADALDRSAEELLAL